MTFLSLSPFVPSGPKFEDSKQLFQELGFTLNWSEGGLANFSANNCSFMLQHFDQKAFAENFMLSVHIDSATEFRKMVVERDLPNRFGIKLSQITQQPYGKEVNIIDIAGVCWHFVE